MTDTPWLTREEAADYIRVHPATLDRYVRKNLVPRYQVGDLEKYRFRREDLDNLLMSRWGVGNH